MFIINQFRNGDRKFRKILLYNPDSRHGFNSFIPVVWEIIMNIKKKTYEKRTLFIGLFLRFVFIKLINIHMHI